MKTKKALVTGAGSGIGAAIAEHLSTSGYHVILLGRNLDKLETTASHLAGPYSCFACDLRSPEAIHQLCQQLKQSDSGLLQGSLEVLVNNAGVFERTAFDETNEHHWQSTFEVNFFGPVHLTRELLPEIKSVSGSIVNIASTLGLRPIEHTSSYSASKAALLSWTQSLALEVASSGTRVNAVCPGLVDTPIHKDWHYDPKAEIRQVLNKLQPMGRVGQPGDIAHAVDYLVSDKASWVTGTWLNVDGGIQLNS